MSEFKQQLLKEAIKQFTTSKEHEHLKNFFFFRVNSSRKDQIIKNCISRIQIKCLPSSKGSFDKTLQRASNAYPVISESLLKSRNTELCLLHRHCRCNNITKTQLRYKKSSENERFVFNKIHLSVSNVCTNTSIACVPTSSRNF